MSVATLPLRGESIGKGGFGEVFLDPENEHLCIKVFQSPLRGAEAQRLLDLVDLVGHLRPSERHLLTTRFAWPLEAFGTSRKIVGYRMPRVPESGVFDLLVAGRMSQQVLQAKYLLDPTWWGRDAVQSEPPVLADDARLLVVADALEAFKLLHACGFAYEDLSSNNVCVLNEDPARVFLLDADSVMPIDGASRDIVRSVDWDVDEQLGPAERDWVKAAMFAWRMLLQDRLARPARDQVADFDNRTGTILGASIVELNDFPGIDAVDQLLESLYGELSRDSERALIDGALQAGYAREVLRYQDFSEMTREVREAAETQIALEERVEQSTGLQRRLLLRGLRERGQATFHLDILPTAVAAAPPRSAQELERLVLAAEFDSLLDNFLDGQLSAFEGHPWRDRAVQHALVMEPGPEIQVADIQGIMTARFHWPPGELVDCARLRIVSAGQVIDERLIERQPGHSSVRIRGIGSGHPAGERLQVRIAFCVRGEDGGIIECPEDAEVTVVASGGPARAASRTPRAIRVAERRSSQPGEAALDVARPDPNAPWERRRRRRRRMTTGAALMIIAAGVLMWGRGDDLYIDAAAVSGADGTEIVWALRTDGVDGATVDDFRVQRRVIGPIWIGRPHTGDEGRVTSGTTVRVTTTSSGTLRVRADLVGRGTVRSAPLTPVTREAVLAAPESVAGLSWSIREDGSGHLSWELPEAADARIVDRVQVQVLDLDGERLLRTSTGDRGLLVRSRIVSSAPGGLEVRVRVVTSDGMRSDWLSLLTGPLPSALIPRPSDLEVIASGTDVAAVIWGYPTTNDTQRFVVTISDPRGPSRVLEVDSPFVPLRDVFDDATGIRVIRVSALLPDGSTGPSSAAIIVRDAQLGARP